jgi:peptide/nickel transport system ATP-binding protein
MMSDIVLSVKDLTVDFPTRLQVLRALDHVSFHIRRGEILGMVGESGAGKSMTGSAVIGLLAPPGRVTGGEIRLGGDRIDNLNERDWLRIRGARIGMVFQDPLTSLNPVYTIGRHLVETIRVHLKFDAAKARERAIGLMEEVGIADASVRVDHYPHQFSGGMRQRIAIALALCAEPELLIADEPTTALDVSVQAQVLNVFRKVCRERGMAAMLITHDMGVIAETADRVAIMYAGRIVEQGPVRQIIEEPRHPYTKGLMGSIPSMTEKRNRLLQIPGSMPRLAALPSGCTFHPRCASASAICTEQVPTPRAEAGNIVSCWLPNTIEP